MIFILKFENGGVGGMDLQKWHWELIANTGIIKKKKNTEYFQRDFGEF